MIIDKCEKLDVRSTYKNGYDLSGDGASSVSCL